MPETFDFAEAMIHLLRGDCIAGPGLPSREHILRCEKIGTADHMVYLSCRGRHDGLWHPKPLDLVREDWHVVEIAEVQLVSSRRIDVLERRIVVLESQMRKVTNGN